MRSSVSSIFEPIFDASILEYAVIATLRKWMPTYLREIELQRNLEPGRIAAPRTYGTRNEFTTFPDEAMPIVVVVSPGLTSEPRADGEGRYSGWWALGVGVVARADDEQHTNQLAKIYGAAVRTILIQKPTLDESWEFNGIQWVDEDFTDVPVSDIERTIRASRNVFQVGVANMATKFVGPAVPTEPDPDTQPGSEWPEVETADVTVNVVEEVR